MLLAVGSVYMYFIIQRIFSVYYSRDSPALQTIKMVARPILHLVVFFFLIGYTVVYWAYITAYQSDFINANEELVECWLTTAGQDNTLDPLKVCGETPSPRPNLGASAGISVLPVTQTLFFLMIFCSTGRFTARLKQAMADAKHMMCTLQPPSVFYGHERCA